MAFLDDKRFLLSHIRHSFITCDDTGMCETVMLAEDANRYRTSSLYAHKNSLFESDSETLSEPGNNDVFDKANDQNKKKDKKSRDEVASEKLLQHYRKGMSIINFDASDSDDIIEAEIVLLKQTEIDYKSELLDENSTQSLDILSSSFDITGSRRRSNTAQKLEKMKNQRKFHSKTKSIPWKSYTKDSVDGDKIKRIVLNPELLSEEDLSLLEYDPVLKVYYETFAYRQKLFPLMSETSKDQITSPSEFESIPEPKEKPEAIKISESTEVGSSNDSTNTNQTQRRKSVLSLVIQKSPKAPQNPFNEYSRFDGRVIEGNAPTKRIRIFFYIFKQDGFKNINLNKHSASLGMITSGKNWIEIVVLASAKISDLIGLICWQYTHLNIGPPLKSDLSYYALKIAEENGDVDTDFPSLNPQDDIKRYGFPYLALVEVQTSIVVTVNIEPDNVFSQIISNTTQMTIGEVVEQIKKKRPQMFRHDPKVFVELKSPPSSASNVQTFQNYHNASNSQMSFDLEMNSKIGDFIKGNRGKLALVLKLSPKASLVSKSPLLDADFKSDHFQMSTSGKLRSNRSFSFLGDHLQSPQASPLSRKTAKDWSQNMLDLIEAPVYQTFDLFVRHKLNWVPIEMGISSSKVELNPKQVGTSRLQFFSRFHQNFKPLTIDIKDVMKTHVSTRQKISLKAQFKLYYWTGSDYKSLKFEGDTNTVNDILCKFDNLIKMFVSPRRNEFVTLKSRKYRAFTARRMFRSKASSSASSSTSSSSSSSSDDSGDEDDKRSRNRVFQRLRGSS